MQRRTRIVLFAVAAAAMGTALIVFRTQPRESPPLARAAADGPVRSATPTVITRPTAAMKLLESYADSSTPPAEDLRKLQRVLAGYFSVVKDPSRHPIGGNEDLAAALRGENPNREAFLPTDHPLFLDDGRIGDRWGSPLIVHPLGWKQIELRSAGPDRTPFTGDDLVLDPSGRVAD